MFAERNGTESSMLICLDFILDLWSDNFSEGFFYGAVSFWTVWAAVNRSRRTFAERPLYYRLLRIFFHCVNFMIKHNSAFCTLNDFHLVEREPVLPKSGRSNPQKKEHSTLYVVGNIIIILEKSENRIKVNVPRTIDNNEKKNQNWIPRSENRRTQEESIRIMEPNTLFPTSMHVRQWNRLHLLISSLWLTNKWNSNPQGSSHIPVCTFVCIFHLIQNPNKLLGLEWMVTQDSRRGR